MSNTKLDYSREVSVMDPDTQIFYKINQIINVSASNFTRVIVYSIPTNDSKFEDEVALAKEDGTCINSNLIIVNHIDYSKNFTLPFKLYRYVGECKYGNTEFSHVIEVEFPDHLIIFANKYGLIKDHPDIVVTQSGLDYFKS